MTGALRIYLGAAPGVGKTFAMLNEGRRRRERGTDVVVGFVETHGRPRTADQVGDLELIPRAAITHRGAELTEMDVDAILRRKPDLVLVDEFAHTNVTGSRNEKRWQDVAEILAAGIDVISTVNVQHLESLNDVVEGITGIRQRETVPDDVVRAADQIELVDMDPDALRRRMAHGNVYAPDKVDAALGNYFRPGNLTALRELALLWVANRVDDELSDYRSRHAITKPWETRERVVVALSGAPGAGHLLRRAARIAERSRGDLIGVHVVADSGLAGDLGPGDIEGQRRLLEELGGSYRKVVGADVAAALVGLAAAENATQIVLGASARSRWQELVNGSIVNRVLRRSGSIDVHVISPEAADDGEPPERPRLPAVRRVVTPLSPRRQQWGWATVALGLPLLTVILANLREQIGLSSVLLLYLVLAMGVALVGGALPAAAAVVGGLLLSNWYFTAPLYQLDVAGIEDVVALVVYAVAAGTVAVLVDRVGRSRLRAARAQAEAEALAALAGALAGPQSTAAMLAELRTTFGLTGAALVHRPDGEWTTLETSGRVAADPAQAMWSRQLGATATLVLDGGPLSAADQRVLDAFTAHVGAAVERERLQREADTAAELAAANTMRASLLQAVSHDLRTPLASIKASISSLRQRDISWSANEAEDFHATIETETDRLADIVANLLDMSRLQASVLALRVEPTGLEDVVLAAVGGLGADGRSVEIDVDGDLTVAADAALLERALANLVANAVRLAPQATPVRVGAGRVQRDGQELVDVRIADRGPGIPRADRERVFQPFERAQPHHAAGSGVGLGLTIARGFVEAMGGELAIEDTPGGGTTMVVTLPAAEFRL